MGESQPLLAPAAKPPSAEKAAAAQRSWRGPWCALFGTGGPEDVSSFCLAWHAPCVAFAWNGKRALGASFLGELVKFALLTVGVFMLVRAAGFALVMSCGPAHAPQPVPFDGPVPLGAVASGPGAGMMGRGGSMMGGPGMMGHPAPVHTATSAVATSAVASTTTTNAVLAVDPAAEFDSEATVDVAVTVDPVPMPSVDADGKPIPIEGPGAEAGGWAGPGIAVGEPGPWGAHPHDHEGWHHGYHHHHDGPPMDIPPECMERVMTGMCVLCAIFIASIAYVIYYAARRRQAIRETFGIPGSFAGDCCLWTWCSVCALSQETRTLMVNQVHEGVWYGEVPGAPAMAPPAAAQMV